MTVRGGSLGDDGVGLIFSSQLSGSGGFKYAATRSTIGSKLSTPKARQIRSGVASRFVTTGGRCPLTALEEQRRTAFFRHAVRNGRNFQVRIHLDTNAQQLPGMVQVFEKLGERVERHGQ